MLTPLDQLLVRGHVELTVQLLAGVADEALIGQDRLDLLLVENRFGPLDLDLGDRLDLGLLLFLGQGQGREQQRKQTVSIHRRTFLMSFNLSPSRSAKSSFPADSAIRFRQSVVFTRLNLSR